MKKIRLKIEGMTCSACSNGLEKYLNKQEGIIDAIVNLVLQEATIKYEDNITTNQLETFIKEAGFISKGIAKDIDIIKINKKNKTNLIIMGLLSIIIFFINNVNSFSSINIFNKKYPLIILLLTIIVLYLSKDILKKGFKNIIHKTPNMDSLVTLSVISSFIYSTIMIIKEKHYYLDKLYFDSVVMVLFFVKLGRYIEENNRVKTMDSIKDLLKITPEKAILKNNNKEKQVTIDEVRKDDILITKPGMKVAVDGIVLKGTSHLDESFITGESKPIKKSVGDKIIAGSMNYEGILEYKASKIGKDSTISEIVHLVVEATNTKAPIVRFADKISSYFVPLLSLIALITLIGHLLLNTPLNEAINTFVTILVVACPCALGLATPLALMVSNGICAKKGILVKSGEILENASKIDTIIFDKTGTLTNGELTISKIYKKNTYEEKELLKEIASIEKNSTHPISHTFTKYAKDNKIELLNVYDFKNIDGIGITGKIHNNIYYLGNNKLIKKLNIKNNPYKDQEIELTKSGNSIVYIIKNNEVIALIGIKDSIRKEAKEVLINLKKLNKEVIMLTGDNEEVANIVSKELNIDKVIANVTPKEKNTFIKKYKEQGKKVMMIGDGINDAPALATADIGVSLETANDIATNTADVIILKNDLTRITSLVIISKKTLNNIYQNLFWACFYNICMIPIAMGLFKGLGISINPIIASIAMILSSLTVEFNTLRLKRIIK